MAQEASIELKGLKLTTQIGTYKPGNVMPNEHMLDLTLWIEPDLILIDRDSMEYVFDYDPIISEIDRLSRDGHYETQERLVSRIVKACAAYTEILGLQIGLSKSPIFNQSGSLGIKLHVDQKTLDYLRSVE